MVISQELSDENKCVALLDVLGFKDIVRTRGKQLDTYFETIDRILADLKSDVIQSQLISDSTILACPFNKDNLMLLLTTIQNIQVKCCLENIWIRGAVSLGDIYVNRDRNIVVGNGLTNAYLLERQEKYPRVIIDPKIVRLSGARVLFHIALNCIDGDMKKEKAIPLIHQPSTAMFFQPLIEDDALFVAFIEKIVLENGEIGLKTLIKIITTELYKGMDNYQKYIWLKKYFAEGLHGMMQKAKSDSADHKFLKHWRDIFKMV